MIVLNRNLRCYTWILVFLAARAQANLCLTPFYMAGTAPSAESPLHMGIEVIRALARAARRAFFALIRRRTNYYL